MHDRPVTNWKIKIDPGAGSKKLMIVVRLAEAQLLETKTMTTKAAFFAALRLS